MLQSVMGIPQSPTGPLSDALPGPYVTPLAPHHEQQFQQWVQTEKIPWQDEPHADYDMRGYWYDVARHGKTAGGWNPVDQRWHFTDRYKTPYHKAFSNQSKYAYSSAPRWVGSNAQGWKLIDKYGQVLVDETRK